MTFRSLLADLGADVVGKLTPDEHRAQRDRTRAQIVELLEPYGRDLVDGFAAFERNAAATMRGNIFR